MRGNTYRNKEDTKRIKIKTTLDCPSAEASLDWSPVEEYVIILPPEAVFIAPEALRPPLMPEEEEDGTTTAFGS